MSKRHTKQPRERAGGDLPVEIPMTDLGWSDDGDQRDDDAAGFGDVHAAGTPGGGTASGGLAGSNVGDGDPDNVNLEDAMGSGIRDTSGEDTDGLLYAGDSGGAVGGTPAQKRAKGGKRGGRLAPGGQSRGDSTVGSPSPKKARRHAGRGGDKP